MQTYKKITSILLKGYITCALALYGVTAWAITTGGVRTGVTTGGVRTVDTGSAEVSTLNNPLKEIGSFGDFVAAILGIVVQIGVPVAALSIIYSGFLFVTARGNPDQIDQAKRSLLYSVLGTAILLGAWVFAQAIGTTIESLA